MWPIRGIVLKLASVALLMIMASLVKALAGTVPPGQVVFFRSAFAAPVIVLWLWGRGELRSGFGVRAPGAHLWRGAVGTTAMGMMFASLGLLPLPEVTAIGYTAPLLVVVFAALFLGEQVGVFRLASVFVGLVGVLIVLSPRLSVETGLSQSQTLGAILALAGAVFAALAQIAVRRMVATESTSSIVFWFSITAAILSLFTLPFGWVVPAPGSAALLVLCGLLGGIGQIFLTASYRHADASLIAPFDYASMLLALAIGYWIFAEVPSVTMLIGAGIVVAAGITIIWRERWLGLKRDRQRRAMTPQG